MILTDAEWLRFVTFGIVSGGIFGAVHTAAFYLLGEPLPVAIGGAVVWTATVAVVIHFALQKLLDRSLTTTDDTDADQTTEDTV